MADSFGFFSYMFSQHAKELGIAPPQDDGVTSEEGSTSTSLTIFQPFETTEPVESDEIWSALASTVQTMLMERPTPWFATRRSVLTMTSAMTTTMSSIGSRHFETPSRQPIESRLRIETAMRIKLAHNRPITALEIIHCTNQELRSRALRTMDLEKFIAETKATVVDRHGEDKLLRIPTVYGEPIMLVHVKDASTPRRYLLQVPPGMQRVREAVAWTFGLDEDEYKPLVET